MSELVVAKRLDRAPFLVWPVARKEFYASIAFALILPLTWGVIIFGWRALLVVLAVLAGASATHWALKRFTHRGKQLIYAHSIMSALLVATLSQALWSPLMMLGAGVAVVGLIWIFGGPGHERIHASLTIAVLLNVIVVWGIERGAERDLGAILARDRLFMGDLQQAAPLGTRQWPRSVEINGQDAVQMARPDAVVAGLMHDIAVALRRGTLDEATQKGVEDTIHWALVTKLPLMEALLLGVMPGAIGAVSGLSVVLGGLYLAYRNILRPKSCATFLVSVIAGLILATLSSRLGTDLGGVGLSRLWNMVPVEELLTLLFYEVFSGDILLAAVFILALPGTEPITPRGRRGYLVLAGLMAGAVHRANLPVPATTLVLLGFQPMTWVFDALLGRKSWLNAGRRA